MLWTKKKDRSMEIKCNKRAVIFSKLPLGTCLLETAHLCRFNPTLSYKVCIFVLTFITYTTYHLARKPFSVVKVVLCPQCTTNTSKLNYSGPLGWAPFDGGKHAVLAYVDYSWLFSYAIALYFSGIIADRVNLRYYLFVGMLGSVINLSMLGIAYFANIHHLAYFIVVQIFGGIMQATGLPAVVAIIGQWFGKQRRGLILGLWYAHTPLGNILGTFIPSFWARTDISDTPWGWAFMVPAFITFVVTIIIFLFMVIDPVHVGIEPPVHHWEEEVQADYVKSIEVIDGSPKQFSGPRESEISSSKGGIELKCPNEPEFIKEAEFSSPDTDEGNNPPISARQGSTCSTVKFISKEPVNHMPQKKKAISFFKALMIPGVIEYSLSLFFDKLVSYTFLFWLPLYVKKSLGWEGQKSDFISAVFDAGGILGGILTGLLSDILHARAFSCNITLLLSIPSLFLLRFVGSYHIGLYTFFLIMCGVFVDGTYAIITTAISSDLGTHVSLKDDLNAKATVTAIIDGTGSLGAAFGPLIVGLLTDKSGWDSAFYFLMASCFVSALFLTRLTIKEMKPWFKKLKGCLKHTRNSSEGTHNNPMSAKSTTG